MTASSRVPVLHIDLLSCLNLADSCWDDIQTDFTVDGELILTPRSRHSPTTSTNYAERDHPVRFAVQGRLLLVVKSMERSVALKMENESE
jgi:hypothetical protein